MQREIRPGYKQTEVGVIPEDWDVIEAFDLEPFITSGSRGWAKYYSDRGALFLRITNLSRTWLYPDLSDQKLVEVPEGDTEGQRTSLQDGDILISITADIGVVGYVGPEVPKPAYINQHIACLRLPANKTDSLFQSYYLASQDPQRRFMEMTDIGAKSGINLTTIGKLKLIQPPLPEQRAIAAALADADGLIAALEGMIAKKRDLKQAAMQQLLTGKTRLPGFSGEWEVKRLGEIGRALIGLTYSPSDIRSFGTLVLRSSNIQNGSLTFDDNVYVDPEVAQSSIIEVGDLLICARNGSRDLIGKSVRLDGRARGMAFGAFMAAYRSEFNNFISLQFQSDLIKRQINEHLGATINQITNKSLLSFQVPLPNDSAEQTAIAEVLSDMDADLTALEAQAAKARAVKQGMMQELLTGRVRLI